MPDLRRAQRKQDGLDDFTPRGCGIGLGVWLLVALALSAGIMGLALDHNPNGEFQNDDTGVIYWDRLAPIGIGGFVTIGLIPSMAAGVLAWIVVLISRRRSSNRRS